MTSTTPAAGTLLDLKAAIERLEDLPVVGSLVEYRDDKTHDPTDDLRLVIQAARAQIDPIQQQN